MTIYWIYLQTYSIFFMF